MVLSLFCFVSLANAKQVHLSWDVNQDASYYVVYYGSEPGVYTDNSEQITQTEYSMEIPTCEKIYFSVKAFNECGNSSDFSDEVSSDPINDAVAPVVNVTVETIITTTITTQTTN